MANTGMECKRELKEDIINNGIENHQFVFVAGAGICLQEDVTW
jgi:hypothetical protein